MSRMRKAKRHALSSVRSECRFVQPEVRGLYREGVRRYGFHGLSYEYIAGALAERIPDIAPGRVVVAHRGSGVSICALAGGRSAKIRARVPHRLHCLGFLLDGAANQAGGPLLTRADSPRPAYVILTWEGRFQCHCERSEAIQRLVRGTPWIASLRSQ